MNNNNRNNNNNRRRGRGNNRGSNGGQQLNRIDSRARGNAPQLLEKYKKLAHDASLNGDRVQTEYYLQFADHYFRVIADSKVPKDDFRGRRDNDRDPMDDDDSEDFDDQDQGIRPAPGMQRRHRDDDDDAADEGEAGLEGSREDADENENPFVRDARPSARAPRGRTRAPQRDRADDGDNAAEAAGNDQPRAERIRNDSPRNQQARDQQPRGEADRSEQPRAEQPRAEQPRRAPARNAPARGERVSTERANTERASLDPGLLPPSIPRDTSTDAAVEDEKPRRAPRPRTRRPRTTEDGGEEALETLS